MDMKEFTAYCRKLMRELDDLQNAMDSKDYEKARVILETLREDTQKDIET